MAITSDVRRKVIFFGILFGFVSSCIVYEQDNRTRDEPDADVWIDARVGDPIAVVSDRHLSVALDLGQVLGANFWNPDISDTESEITYDPYDFSRDRLRTLSKALSPAMLRIGGTESDRVYYAMGEEAPNPLPEGYESVLTEAIWKDVIDFANDVGFSILFTVNAGRGPRVENSWTLENTHRLLQYSVANDAPVTVWEFGNEPNAYPLFYDFSLSPSQYADEFVRFQEQVLSFDLEARVAGPAVAYWPILGEFSPYTPGVIERLGSQLQVLTWHYYPTQSQRCPVQNRKAELDTLMNPEYLDEVLIWGREIQDKLSLFSSDAELWLGETGNAQCGGEPGVSDRWAGSFWWADQLGLLSKEGQTLMVRQTLSGSDYGLLDDVTLEPRPDYWVSLLWKKLMGQIVLDVTSSEEMLRLYAHCHPTAGQTLLGINLDDSRSIGVQDVFGIEYRLEAQALDSRQIQLNGYPLEVTDSGNLPSLQGYAVTKWVIPPRSISFLHRDVPCGS